MSATAKRRMGDAPLVGAALKSDLDGWETFRWEEVCEKIQDGTHFSPVTDPSGEFKYLTSKNIRFGYLDLRNVEFIDEPQHRAIYKRCSVRQSDVLLTKDGANTGNAAVNSLVEEFSLLSSVALIRPDPRRLSPDFLLQTILSEQGQRMIKDAMSGLAITRITLEIIKAFSIASPPLTEQTKIAEILSTVDRAIEQTEALIAKQQRLKTGLMQDLLTRGIDEHGRIRPEETHEFKDSPLGRIPVEWEVKALEECVDFWDAKRIPLKQDDRDKMEGEFPYYGASGIIDYIDKFLFDDELILIGEDGENVISRHLPLAFKVSGKIWVNNHAHVLKPKSGQHIDFLTDRLEFYDYSLLVSGSAQPKLNQKNLRQMALPIPPTAEQKRIGAVFLGLKQVEAGRNEDLAKLKALKTGLMQDLLNGRRRVTTLLDGKGEADE